MSISATGRAPLPAAVDVQEAVTFMEHVFGSRVAVPNRAIIEGHVSSDGDCRIGAGAAVTGNVAVLGTLRLGANARVGNVLCSALDLEGPAHIAGDLVVGRPVNGLPTPLLRLAPDVRVDGNVLSAGSVVLAGDRRTLDVIAGGSLHLQSGTKVRLARAGTTAVVDDGCEIEALHACGDTRLGAGVLARLIRCDARLEAGGDLHFDRLQAAEVILGERANAAGATEPRGYVTAVVGAATVGAGAHLRRVAARSDTRIGRGARITVVEAGATARIDADAQVERIHAGGEADLASGARVGRIDAGTVHLRSNSRADEIRSAGDVVLEAESEAGVVVAKAAIRFVGAARVIQPALIAGPEGLVWDVSSPPVVWGAQLSSANVFPVDAAGRLDARPAATTLATTLLDRAILAQAPQRSVEFRI